MYTSYKKVPYRFADVSAEGDGDSGHSPDLEVDSTHSEVLLDQ